MRRILVDAARARGGAEKLNLDDVAIVSPEKDDAVVALDAALTEFAKVCPRQARVLELRYFGSLEEEEIAEAMRTVERDWNF